MEFKAYPIIDAINIDFGLVERHSQGWVFHYV